MDNTKLQHEIDNSFEVAGAAITGRAAQVAYYLRKFGKRATRQFVEAQGKAQELKRANFYENILRWLAALFFANYAGFEYLWTHLQVFVAELERERVGKANILSFPNAGAADGFIIAEIVKLKRSLELIAMRLEAAQ